MKTDKARRREWKWWARGNKILNLKTSGNWAKGWRNLGDEPCRHLGQEPLRQAKSPCKVSDTVSLQEGRRRTQWQEGSKLGNYWEMRSEEDVSFHSESSEEPPRVGWLVFEFVWSGGKIHTAFTFNPSEVYGLVAWSSFTLLGNHPHPPPRGNFSPSLTWNAAPSKQTPTPMSSPFPSPWRPPVYFLCESDNSRDLTVLVS